MFYLRNKRNGNNSKNNQKDIKISATKRKAAAKWANSRVGKGGYSTNFVTNRKLSK